jgi:hypothetical protein
MKSRKMQILCQGYPGMAPHRILSGVQQSNWGILAGYRSFCSKPDSVGYPEHIFKSSGDYYKFLEEAST